MQKYEVSQWEDSKLRKGVCTEVKHLTFLCFPIIAPVWLMTTAVFQIVSPWALSL